MRTGPTGGKHQRTKPEDAGDWVRRFQIVVFEPFEPVSVWNLEALGVLRWEGEMKVCSKVWCSPEDSRSANFS